MNYKYTVYIVINLLFIEGYAPGSYEKATLRFAHAETLVPFSCLIGLFLEGSGEYLLVTFICVFFFLYIYDN